MKQSFAAAPAETWNQKNQPSDVQQLEQSPGPMEDVIEHLPSAAFGLVRRRPGVFILALIGIAGMVWYLSKRD